MKLRIKQKFFSITDSFDIYDEAMNIKYKAGAELFSFGYILKLFDLKGNEIAIIKQKLFTILPEFNIYIGGEYRGSLKKRFTLFSNKYDLDYREWHVIGDFLFVRSAYKKGNFQSYRYLCYKYRLSGR